MREGSYMEIEPGMKVVDPRGDTVGAVDQVVVDEESGIFVGLAVRHGLLIGEKRLVHGEHVEALQNGVVHITRRWQELEEYIPVEERVADAQQGFA
jgi:sporulation protein YlmC with PRC-barrel domain